MVKVKQFSGATSKTEIVSELACRPYDTITRAEAKELSNNIEHSFYRVIRPEIDLPAQVDEYDPQVYRLAQSNLQKFIENSFLEKDTESRFYAYEIEYMGYKSLGLFLLARIKDYEDGVIKRHELTRNDKEQDRTQIIDKQNANAEPILITYAQQDNIEQVLQKAVGKKPYLDAHCSDDDSNHRVWKLSKEESNYVEEQFKSVAGLYIADGHHRMAASTNIATQRREEAYRNGIELTGDEPWEYIFTFAVSFNNLKIMPYNRIVKSLKDKTPEHILQEVANNFEITLLSENDTIDPTVKGQYAMNLQRQWYRLIPKEESVKAIQGDNPTCDQKLDVYLLQQLLINPVLGIKEIRTDKNIDFLGGVEGFKGLERVLEQNSWDIAFSCYPVHISEIVEISDKKKIMLPKATWIIPKPRSGLVVRLF